MNQIYIIINVFIIYEKDIKLYFVHISLYPDYIYINTKDAMKTYRFEF